MTDAQQIGIDITRQIEEHMATYPLPPGFEQHIARLPATERENTLWLAKFAPSAVEVAVYYGYGRGFTLADRMGKPTRYWFVRRNDLEKAVTRATPETITAIQNLLSSYKPSREGVMVIVTMDWIQPFYLNARGELSSPGNFKRIPLVKQTPINFPGVRTRRVQTEQGVTYFHEHETLGDLGSVEIQGFGVQSKMQVNVAPGDPDDPQYRQRLDLFRQIVAELDQKFHAMLGQPVPDQSWLDDMPEVMPLFSAFLAADNSLDLDTFLHTLTGDQLHRLLKQAELAMSLSKPQDAEAIRQRIVDLYRLLLLPEPFTPVQVGLSQFVRAASDEEAETILLDQADLLLQDSVFQEWDGLIVYDESMQRRIEDRKRLWQTIWAKRTPQ